MEMESPESRVTRPLPGYGAGEAKTRPLTESPTPLQERIKNLGMNLVRVLRVWRERRNRPLTPEEELARHEKKPESYYQRTKMMHKNEAERIKRYG